MPNESGFVDYSQFAALNGNDEEQNLQEAMAAAEAADNAAAHQLMKVRQQTAGYSEGIEGDITKAASYSDYLVAKQKAAKAWQAAQVTGSDPRMAALRGDINKRRGLSQKADAASAELNRREGVVSAEAIKGSAEGRKNKDDVAAYYAKLEADKKARADADKKSKADFNASILNKMKGVWNNMDRSANNFWGQNGGPANVTVLGTMGTVGHVGQEDNERLAQIARAQGMNKQADQFEDDANYVFGKRYDGGL